MIDRNLVKLIRNDEFGKKARDRRRRRNPKRKEREEEENGIEKRKKIVLQQREKLGMLFSGVWNRMGHGVCSTHISAAKSTWSIFFFSVSII